MSDQFITESQAYLIANALEKGLRHAFEGYQGYTECLYFNDGQFVQEVFFMPDSTTEPVDTKYYDFEAFVKMIAGKKFSWYKSLLEQ